MSNRSEYSGITSSLQGRKSELAKEHVEEMEEQKRKAFENALKHGRASMIISKYTGMSAISKMIVNS